jgi:iron complex outermembrane recepter protein
VRGSGSIVLPQIAGYRQSLAIDGQRLGFTDRREAVADEHLLYRGAGKLGAGTLRIDLNVASVRDVPPSPVIRVGAALTPATPVDANFNPADARIGEDKYQLALGYSLATAWGAWDSLASFAYSDVTDIRAFLHPDLSGTADTQNQRRHIDDDYFDTHLTRVLAPETTLVVGADLLYGRGGQTTRNGNGAYTVPLDGSVLPPATSAVTVDEIGTLDDRRWFSGVYLQLDWKAGARWDVNGGVRLNDAYERKNSSDLVLPPPQLASAVVAKTMIRPTETIGASYRAWAAGRDELVAYAALRHAFKPAALDFGPDYTPDLLSPETAQSYEAGIKGAAAGGRLSYQAALFWMNFDNLVVATSSGALANAAGERLKGIEVESRYRLARDLSLAASASVHDARFTHYLYFDGAANVDVGGRRLTLSPRNLASLGILYAPNRGLNATVVARYVGRRYLDEENTAPVGGYTTLDATIGERLGGARIWLEGNNLTNRRPPVTASEFGSQSFYLLPARMLWLRIGYSWR